MVTYKKGSKPPMASGSSSKTSSPHKGTGRKDVIAIDDDDDDEEEEVKGGDEDDEDDDEEEEEGYELEKIIDHKKTKDGWLFLVKWVGYGDEDNTWEPEEHMQNPETIQNYWKSLPSSRQPQRLAQLEAAKQRVRRPSSTPSRTDSPNNSNVKSQSQGKANASSNGRGGRTTESGGPLNKFFGRGATGASASSGAGALSGGGSSNTKQGRETQDGMQVDDDDDENERFLDDEVDDETWYAMEKEWKDKYDSMESWEDVVIRVFTLEKEPHGEVLAYLDFPENVHLVYPLQVARRKCPQHLLNFYEAHLRFKDPKTSSRDQSQGQSQSQSRGSGSERR